MKAFPRYTQPTNGYPWILALLAGICLTACSSSGKKKGGQTDSTALKQPKVYSVLTLAPRKEVLYADFPAIIQGEQNVEIRPKVDGFVEAIFVDEGATVKKGQRLFRINAPQYEQDVLTAQAGVRTAQADVSSALLAVNKVRPLVEKDIISKYELETAQYTLASKQAALAQAQAALANAQTNLGYTNLVSPVSGVVGSIPYKIGSLVTSTTTNPLTTISGISEVYAYFALNEKQLLDFTRDVSGNTLQEKLAKLPDVLLLLADGSTYNYKGRIKTAIGQIDTQTGSSNFRATFPNPQALLRSGNSGTVRVPRTIDSALVVPQSATSELQDKRFLFVVEKNNKVKTTAVTVTPTPDGQYFVVQKGLKAGDKVVLDGGTGLKDGASIKPKPASPAIVFKTTAPASTTAATDTDTEL
ncbi:efflux RND transporter periplasmic adaptor subunit [Spirosoma sp. HMF4905]|uniref:Efflux RND transporter periplasmic adaptor subunit n=1 Tax=Spirosoma arboris TaxID=2682092 RepID=A0A7K1SGJ4_9BACT|nr:efflux RND transporter periplasmic adaptor subunit [Spirosoma arboris]MVM32939.1 efflux RND transporter periplasmic adaptor subunit [Spirosoma arboris]